MQHNKSDYQKAAEIVRDAGGLIVGRTKLQKVAYLLELAGLGEGFDFRYRHYGPYSEDLATAIHVAGAFDFVTEEERPANWGGTYSIYRATSAAGERSLGPRAKFAEEAAKIDSIELELAATAAYLYAVEGCPNPWERTAQLKPDKIHDGRLDRAKEAYAQLLDCPTPKPLPQIL
jgi:hypothetical protein